MADATLWGLVRRAQDPESHRPLDPKERYRALNDAFDLQQELVDLGDHKARFALVIMGGLNALAFLLLARGGVVEELPRGLLPWLGAYLGVYALCAVYFFFQAIESLKPRIYSSAGRVPPPSLRFFEGILGRGEEEFRAAWSAASLEQLNEELAEQIHSLAHINRQKYTALRRLYLGLQIMTLLTAGIVAVLEIGTFL